VSSIIFSISFLCLFLATVIGLAAGLVIRGFIMPKYRPREGNDARTLRLMEVSATEARREIAELRATLETLRVNMNELGLGDSMKKLALLDAMWNKLAVLESMSTRIVSIDGRIAGLEDGVSQVAAQQNIPVTVDMSSIPPPVMPNEDDLTAIKGIGPVLSRALRRLGVYSYAQIAAWTPEEADGMQAKIGHGRAHVRRDEWVAQARALLDKRGR
jgi:predicted flap endonuclease-1-like 5' DNA nuclease